MPSQKVEKEVADNKEGADKKLAAKTRQRQLTESRRELFARLENPEITLEEAALLLNLCRATVRRYSNSGLLPSHRTAGGQRRFYFQDIKKLLLEKQKQKKKR